MSVDNGLLVLGREHVWVRHDVILFSLTNAGRLRGLLLPSARSSGRILLRRRHDRLRLL